jgi:hypothetical protein
MMRAALVVLLCVLVAACATKPPPQSMVSLPPAPPPGEPPAVTDMNAAQLRVAFGAPAFTRKDGIAEMWRYDGTTCKAFFFLYPNGSDMSVRHVETVPHNADAAADPACLNALRVSQPPVS